MLRHGTKGTSSTNTHTYSSTSSCNSTGSRIVRKTAKDICCLLPSPIVTQNSHNCFVGLSATHFCDGIHTYSPMIRR